MAVAFCIIQHYSASVNADQYLRHVSAQLPVFSETFCHWSGSDSAEFTDPGCLLCFQWKMLST